MAIQAINEKQVPFAISLHREGRVTFSAVLPEGAGPEQFFVLAKDEKILELAVKEIGRRQKISVAMQKVWDARSNPQD